MTALAFGVAAWVFAIGVYGAIVSRNLIHLALCLTVAQSSTYILLLTIGYRNHAGAPIFKGVEVGTRAVDPVVQSLTLTDVVVSVTVIALILALSLDVHRQSGSIDPDELSELEG
ncbi:sodium:proton antiporter [Gaiella sp.]|jgi:multicomponent Na+:H+ antiporter subunit C|uniref:sodium:proton antiporter n=1 Tax=Gaiella sp. TaxID=2663207 RepID=UPI002E33E7A0|nr:NADH-quinone oxidoreductase subunit K [Gaiella sp.]HEX5583843.1 NADH-quinone oxidoreductase subunit K [Gaiella sp.]